MTKHFAELTTTELYEILKARFAVFYMEQHIYYQDFDDVDYQAYHIAIFREGKVVAYARLFAGEQAGEWMLGRMLTIERGQGLGKKIVTEAEAFAKQQGGSTLLFHAQAQAVPFYEKLGYSTDGTMFMEADIPHILMKKKL